MLKSLLVSLFYISSISIEMIEKPFNSGTSD
jgi:hypothetical protein